MSRHFLVTVLMIAISLVIVGCPSTEHGSQPAAPQIGRSNPALSAAKGTTRVTSQPVADEQLTRWAEACWIGANENVDRMKGWWESPDVLASGVLPFIPVDAQFHPVPTSGSVGTTIVANFAAGSVTFSLGSHTSCPFTQRVPAPTPAEIRMANGLPIHAGPLSLETQPQTVRTLGGIAWGFAHLSNPGQARAHAVRDQLRLIVPTSTLTALAALGPLEIRKSPAGTLGILFWRDGTRWAITGSHTVRMISGCLPTDKGEPPIRGTIYKSSLVEIDPTKSGTVEDHPESWPMFVDSLADL